MLTVKEADVKRDEPFPQVQRFDTGDAPISDIELRRYDLRDPSGDKTYASIVIDVNGYGYGFDHVNGDISRETNIDHDVLVEFGERMTSIAKKENQETKFEKMRQEVQRVAFKASAYKARQEGKLIYIVKTPPSGNGERSAIIVEGKVRSNQDNLQIFATAYENDLQGRKFEDLTCMPIDEEEYVSLVRDEPLEHNGITVNPARIIHNEQEEFSMAFGHLLNRLEDPTLTKEEIDRTEYLLTACEQMGRDEDKPVFQAKKENAKGRIAEASKKRERLDAGKNKGQKMR